MLVGVKQNMTENNFDTAEVGDWFERERGMVDYYKVVDVEETFGDRVRVVCESRNISTKTESETVRDRFDEFTFNSEFKPIANPRKEQ